MASESDNKKVSPEIETKLEGKQVENVTETEVEEPHFTLAINIPHFPGKTYVFVSLMSNNIFLQYCINSILN